MADRNHHGISPKVLAATILAHPNYTPGEQVILGSCNTGANSTTCDNYAQKLADALGTGAVVWAPNGYLIYDDSGCMYLENPDADFIKFTGR